LLAVAAEAKVLEKTVQCELRRRLEALPIVDAHFELALEINQLGADPHIEPLESVHPEVHQVALAAAFQLDGCRAQVLTEDLDSLGSRGPARQEFMDHHAVKSGIAATRRHGIERPGSRVAAMPVHPIEESRELFGEFL